jgi:Leucine-rich repeat (LRR) protein
VRPPSLSAEKRDIRVGIFSPVQWESHSLYSENNALTGTIPIELSAANSLEMLYLNGNDFGGSLDAAFCDTNIAFFEFVADCRGAAPEVKCSCCTSCCNADGSNCTDIIEPLVENPDSPQTSTATAKPVTTPEGGTTVDSSKLKEVLATVSDASLLDAKHTDQFKAFMWMARMDPSPLDIDTTPSSVVLQKYIMTLLYVSTNGKQWKNQNSYLSEVSVCDWVGLTCNDDGELVSIVLESNHLAGTLVSEIGSLGPSLKELQLGMNMLQGELPSEIGLLTSLTKLDLLDNNEITGTIPSELSTKFLPDLEKVQLVGTGISGNLDPLFCTDDPNDDGLRNISANCFGPSVSCACCNVCCDATGENCRVMKNEE